MMPSMWSGVLFEENLDPEIIVPEQFFENARRRSAAAPETLLAVAVLERAVADLREYRYRTRRRYQRLYMEAYEWVASNNRSWPFSFVNLCEVLNLPVDGLRGRLIGGVPASKDAPSPYRLWRIEEAA